MMTMRLADAADALHVRHPGVDVEFMGVSTNTRTLVAENLFFALSGPRFDGHDHLAEEQLRGAAAAVVSRAVVTDLPFFRVADTRLALGQLASSWRSRFDLPVVGPFDNTVCRD